MTTDKNTEHVTEAELSFRKKVNDTYDLDADVIDKLTNSNTTLARQLVNVKQAADAVKTDHDLLIRNYGTELDKSSDYTHRIQGLQSTIAKMEMELQKYASKITNIGTSADDPLMNALSDRIVQLEEQHLESQQNDM